MIARVVMAATVWRTRWYTAIPETKYLNIEVNFKEVSLVQSANK